MSAAESGTDDADRLVRYARQVGLVITSDADPCYEHVGAILVDGVLQAGFNYRTVRGRALAFRDAYPQAGTTRGLLALGGAPALGAILNFTGRKPARVLAVARYLDSRQPSVQTWQQLAEFLTVPDHRADLLDIPGIGPKTYDYLGILVGLDRIAVDVHLIGFAVLAGVNDLGYTPLRSAYEAAADRLGCARRALDRAVWRHMRALPTARTPAVRPAG